MKHHLHLTFHFSFLFVLIFCLAKISYGSENYIEGAHLFASIGPGLSRHQTLDNTYSDEANANITTYIIYKIPRTPFAFGVTSFAQYTPYVDKITLIPNGITIKGSGNYSSASFGPRLQYFFDQEYFKSKFTSLSVGYLIAGQSYKIKKKRYSSSPENEILGQKITYEGHGYFLSLSFYDKNEEKNEFPWFMECTFKYLRGKSQTVVGGTKFEVKPLLKEEHTIPVREITLLLSIGLKLI